MLDLLIGSTTLVCATVVGFFYFSKLKPRWIRSIPWFLLFTFTIQFFGYFYTTLHFGSSNHFIFNLYTYIEYGFYLCIFYKALEVVIFKRLVLGVFVAFTLLYCFLIFFKGNFFIYSTLARNMGELFVLLCGMLYLAGLLISDDNVVIFEAPMFWITTGIMMACLGDFLYFAFFDYIFNNDLDPGGVVYGIVTTSLSVIEFGFVTIGLFKVIRWKRIN